MSTNIDLYKSSSISENGSAVEDMVASGMLSQWKQDEAITGYRINNMADDLTKQGRADDTRININQDYEVRYWSQQLGVSADRLKAAVRAVGPMVADVKKYLGV